MCQHVGVAEVNGYDRLLVFSDAAMIIAPDLGQSPNTENAVKAARRWILIIQRLQ